MRATTPCKNTYCLPSDINKSPHVSYIKHHIDCIESKTGDRHLASPEAASHGIEAVLQVQRPTMTHVSERGGSLASEPPPMMAPSHKESRLPKDDALLCLDTR